MDLVSQIVKLGEARRVVRVGYRRPNEPAATEYLVEPYRLHRGPAGPALRAWQLAPAADDGGGGWRDFRLDRITAADDAGRSFEPRIAVSLAAPPDDGPAGPWSERRIGVLAPGEEYFQYLEAAMLDAQVTPDELAAARTFGARLAVGERHAVHARVFANVLHEVLQDARITHREELYLGQVRAFLQQLGWAP